MQNESFLIAGVDEVGRGPLAGPVVAAAVILDPSRRIDGLLDSKMLDETTREELNVLIRRHALAWSIAEASVEEIDTINILHASMLAMSRAVASLAIKPDLALIDGNRCPQVDCPSQAVVKGDQRVQAISAASIIAKVSRDNFMQRLHDDHPQYGFASHKGYPTVQHRRAILEHGVMQLHRRSFKPVREALQLAELNATPVNKPDVTGTPVDGIPCIAPDVSEKQDNKTQRHGNRVNNSQPNKAKGRGTQTQPDLPGMTTLIA